MLTFLNRVFRWLPAALLIGSLSAAAGEAAKPAEKPAEKPKPLAIQPQVKKMFPIAAARCGTAVLAKVLSVGEVKPDENPPPQDQPEIQMLMQMGGWWGGGAVKAQRARCQAVELIRGDPGLKEFTVVCRHFDFNAARQALWEEARAAAQKEKKNPNMNVTEEDMFKRAALAAGETYLLVLMPDETAATAAGEKPPVFSTAMFPAQAPAEDLLGDVRKMAKRIREYQNPPELTAAQRAAAEKHLADLAAADYPSRAKANDALLALGPAVRQLLEETGKATRDLEVRERCKVLLDDLKPLPGGAPEDWAGTAAIKKPAEKPDEKTEDGKGPKDVKGGGAAANAPAVLLK